MATTSFIKALEQYPPVSWTEHLIGLASPPPAALPTRFETPPPTPKKDLGPAPSNIETKKLSQDELAAIMVRLVLGYFLFPIVSTGGVVYNVSLCGANLLCAAALFKADKQAARALIKTGFVHVAMAVNDFAIGYFHLTFALACAIIPQPIKSFEDYLVREYKKMRKIGDDKEEVDVRSIYERLADMGVEAVMGNEEQKRWYQRLFEVFSFKPV